jgi:hypothetical protein
LIRQWLEPAGSDHQTQKNAAPAWVKPVEAAGTKDS